MRPLVAVDALTVGDPPQGIGAYCLNLARALAAEPGKFRYALFLPQAATSPFRELVGPSLELVPCRLPPGRAGRILYQHALLPRLAREAGAVLLHAAANLLPLRWRGPSLLTVHDLDFREHPDCSPPARRLLFGLLTPPSLARASAVAADSSFAAEQVRRFYPRTPSGKVTVVPLGAPPLSTAVPDVAEALSRLGLREGYILMVGSLERRKNIPAAIGAFERWLDLSGRDVRLVLAGRPGFGWEGIRRRIESSPRRENILVTGYVPATDVPALYAGATALLLLSEAEGFGLPALEAMAHGCPVVAARAGALPETCGDGAILVQAGNPDEVAGALETLASGGPARDALVAKGLANLVRFTWAEHARLVRDLYARLLPH